MEVCHESPRNREGIALDRWEFLKWRKTLRYTQAEAADLLGVNRGTIQHWESGITRVPKAAELATQVLTRRWRQRPDFGPVALIHADNPIWQQADGPYVAAALQCERFSDNDGAIERATQLK